MGAAFGEKNPVKKDGFGNHSEATINLNLKLNYENSYFIIFIYFPCFHRFVFCHFIRNITDPQVVISFCKGKYYF